MEGRGKGVVQLLPQARKDELIIQELPEETLVYDLKRHRAYCLNRTAALVWRQCDGHATVADVVRHLRDEMKAPVDEAVVWLALNRLDRAHLLQKPPARPAEGTAYSRREMIRSLGLIGGLAVVLPAVEAIIAPTAASAASCLRTCGPNDNCKNCFNTGSRTCDKWCRNGSCVNQKPSFCP